MLENGDDNDKAIFVGNLHSSVKEEILYELFLQAGPVQKVIIPRDLEGHQRSFGFVYYKHAEAAPYAAELLDGIWLYGRPIRLKCNFAVSHADATGRGRRMRSALLEVSSERSSDPSPPGPGPTGFPSSLYLGVRVQHLDDHHWSDLMSGLPPAHSFAPGSPVLGLHLPPVVPAPSPLWLNSWIPCSNVEVLGCSDSSEGNEENGPRHKHGGNLEKRRKHKKRR